MTQKSASRANFMTLGTALLLLGAVSTKSFAADNKDIELLSKAKISITDAIGIAEKHQSGTAIEADLDDENSKVVYDVTVVKDKKLYELRIDAVTGDVIRVEEDK